MAAAAAIICHLTGPVESHDRDKKLGVGWGWGGGGGEVTCD